MIPPSIVTLARQCESQVAKGSKCIVVVMHGQRKASATRRRLAGRRGPYGEIVSDTEDGQIVSFNPLEVLAFFAAQGWIIVETVPDKSTLFECSICNDPNCQTPCEKH